ncbi:MAG: PilZ domain-containing protein [Deltaproteobacteria bacterium]|nr:MAG: PilZ domain-containing protein [Deltaproteobacteria bacterium]
MNISDKQVTYKEKRKDVRHSCSKVAEIFVQDRKYLGCIKNESKSGVFIETTGRFSVGQDVSVSFQSPTGQELKKTATIVKVNPEGIGIKYNWPGYNR